MLHTKPHRDGVLTILVYYFNSFAPDLRGAPHFPFFALVYFFLNSYKIQIGKMVNLCVEDKED